MKFPLHVLTWKFIPVRAPNWGGWWERLIALVKRSLRVCLRHSLLDFESLNCFLQESAAVINSRPISPDLDSNDVQAISPADFLFPIPPPGHPVDHLDEAVNHARHFRLADMASRMLWKRFSTEYLAALSTWSSPRRRTPHRVPSVGDVILVHENSPRGSWPLGRIIRTITSEDGTIRSAEVVVRGKTCIRSVRHLYPLEGCSSDPSSGGSERGGVV